MKALNTRLEFLVSSKPWKVRNSFCTEQGPCEMMCQKVSVFCSAGQEADRGAR